MLSPLLSPYFLLDGTRSGTSSIYLDEIFLDGNKSVTIRVPSTPLDGKCAVIYSILWGGIGMKCYLKLPSYRMDKKSNVPLERIP